MGPLLVLISILSFSMIARCGALRSGLIKPQSTTSRAIRPSARAMGARSSDRERDYEYHLPVMLGECLDYLDIKPEGLYLDCTLGGGGHSKAILDRGGQVIGLDQDSDAIARASIVCKEYLESGKMEIFQTNFRNAVQTVLSQSKLIQENGLGGVSGVLMDLGISSHQIDEASRGFAFGAEGPLDMRMEQRDSAGGGELTAATIVNEWDVDDLANCLYDYGDESRSRQIAREIVVNRPHHTTTDVKEAISRVTSFKRRSPTLARCFQALRIVVNDEMGALDEALDAMHKCVVPGGRLVIMSYHSLEDKRVKNLMKHGTAAADRRERVETSPQRMDIARSAYDLAGATKVKGPWKQLFKRAQSPSEEEIERNRRARSAKLRVAERRNDNVFDSGDSGTGDDKNKYKKIGKKQLEKMRKQEESEQE